MFPAPKMVNEPPRKLYTKHWGHLKRKRDQYMYTWEELADFVLPFIGMRYEHETSYQDRRPRRGKRQPVIINNKATMAARVLINGLAGGLTSPARPWIKLGLPQGTGQPNFEARKWLDGASKAILWLCSTSNYYTGLKLQYRDLAVFGIGAKILDEHPVHNVNAVNSPVGSYCIALGEDGRPQALYRDTIFTVGQMVERFGYRRCSRQVQKHYDEGNYFHEVKVCHVIEPNRMYQGNRYGPRGMKFASVYYETTCGDDEQQLLSYRGYIQQPFTAPRWDFLPGDTYGSSAALETLGDIKALQVLEHRKAQAVDKQVSPPTQSPPSLANQRINHLPGGNTVVPEVNSQIRALYEIRPDMLALHQEIQRHEGRIDEAFYVDILKSATDLTRQNVKAEEIVERREEKMLMLSPVLESLYTELLDLDVQRLLAIGLRIGLIPQPPSSLREQQLRIEYTSTLAQAQKAVSIGSIERLFTFGGGLLGVYPEAKDVLDPDAAIEEYAEAVGSPPGVLVPEQARMQLRQQRQLQAEQQEQRQQTAEGVAAAKNLSEAKMSDPNLLSFLIGGGQ